MQLSRLLIRVYLLKIAVEGALRIEGLVWIRFLCCFEEEEVRPGVGEILLVCRIGSKYRRLIALFGCLTG